MAVDLQSPAWLRHVPTPEGQCSAPCPRIDGRVGCGRCGQGASGRRAHRLATRIGGYMDGSIADTGSDHRRHTRREFIKRVIASGAVASAVGFGVGGLSGCTPGRRAVAGSVERLMSLDVNGQVRRVDVLPQETLAMTLRYKLGLTGTKLGCDRAECGACTVMIDGTTYYSCSTLTHAVRGRKVVTVEGLRGPSGELHPVQQAFVDEL